MNYSKEIESLKKLTGDSREKIESVFQELEDLSMFSYQYQILDTLPHFLNKEPYLSFLKGNQGIMLSVCTLGALVDRKIRALEILDLKEAYLYDLCANRMIEKKADEFENGLNLQLSARFCPGYQKSPLEDINEIFSLVKPKGVSLSKSHLMIPCKSMAGILAIGSDARLECSECNPASCPKEKACLN